MIFVIDDSNSSVGVVGFASYYAKFTEKITDTITTPYNSAIETAKAVTIFDYQRIYDERKPSWISNEYEDAVYILGIKTRAQLMLGASYLGDAALIIGGGLSGQDISINAGCYFLTYYLANIGGYEQYDGKFPAIKDENGLECYNRYVNYLLNVCESGTKEGHILFFMMRLNHLRIVEFTM